MHSDAVRVPPPVFHLRVSRTGQPVRLVWKFTRRQSRHRAAMPLHYLMLCADSDSPVKRGGSEREVGSGSAGGRKRFTPLGLRWSLILGDGLGTIAGAPSDDEAHGKSWEVPGGRGASLYTLLMRYSHTIYVYCSLGVKAWYLWQYRLVRKGMHVLLLLEY